MRLTDTYKRRRGENLSARKCGQRPRELIEGMIEISPLKSTIKTRFGCTPMDLVNFKQ